MTQVQVIFEATIGHVYSQIEAAPAVDRAWQEFRAAYMAVDGILTGAGQHGRALTLEETVNGYASELVRAAFLAGLAFDGRALLLEAAGIP